MTTDQDADELAVRDRLVDMGVGPDADPPDEPPTPEEERERERDWLDDILDSDPTPAPDAEPEPTPDDEATDDKPAKPSPSKTPKPTPAATKTKPQAKTRKKRKKKKRKRPGPNTPRAAFDHRPASPRQSLLDAYAAVPYRLKWLAYHAAAAYLGWSFGLVDWVTHTTAWIAHTGLYGAQAIGWYLVGAITFLLHHATRRRWWPVAWLAAVPAASTVVGVLLYGTPHP